MACSIIYHSLSLLLWMEPGGMYSLKLKKTSGFWIQIAVFPTSAHEPNDSKNKWKYHLNYLLFPKWNTQNSKLSIGHTNIRFCMQQMLYIMFCSQEEESHVTWYPCSAGWASVLWQCFIPGMDISYLHNIHVYVLLFCSTPKFTHIWIENGTLKLSLTSCISGINKKLFLTL